MPQVIRRSGNPPEPAWQREVPPGVVVLVGIVLLVFILFMVNQFVTPIFPQKRISEQQAWQYKEQELRQRLPQGGWVSPAPGMPPVYVPPSTGQTTPMAQGR